MMIGANQDDRNYFQNKADHAIDCATTTCRNTASWDTNHTASGKMPTSNKKYIILYHNLYNMKSFREKGRSGLYPALYNLLRITSAAFSATM